MFEEVFLHGTSTNSYAVAIGLPSREHLNQIASAINAKDSF